MVRSGLSNTVDKFNDPIKCVLFDLDNTLVGIPNTWSYFDNIIKEVIQENFHLPIPSKNQRDSLWRSGKEYISILNSWGIKEPNDFWKFFDINDAEKRKRLIENDKLILYQDVVPTLLKLKSIKDLKMGIVTNTPMFIAKEELMHYDLIRFFDEIIGLGENQEICKPEPDGIIQILSRLNCNHENTIYIGDSLVDLLAAKRANVIPIVVDRFKKERVYAPDLTPNEYYKIRDLSEIFLLFNFN